MASYNTVPAADEPLLQKPTKSNRKFIVAGVAAAMFFLGALASGPIASKFESTGTTDLSESTGTCISVPPGGHGSLEGVVSRGSCMPSWTYIGYGVADDHGAECMKTQYGCEQVACDGGALPWCMVDETHWCYCESGHLYSYSYSYSYYDDDDDH